MKTTINIPAIALLMTFAFFSCAKKVQTTKTTTEEKDKAAKTTITEKKIVTTEKKTTTTVITTKTDTELPSPVPPVSVEKLFHSDYPSATGEQWSKQVPLVKTATNNTSDYKVLFTLGDTKNMIIYSEKGELIETKMQITPDQLPPNIYNAVKTQYPDAHIVSAATVKNVKLNGSYAVVIRTTTPNSEKELLLTENGKFVE